MSKITDKQLLELIAHLVESDAGFESDCVLLDQALGRKLSEREVILAELVGEIYKIVHPRFSDCGHYNWEKNTERLIKELKIKE